MCYNEYMNLDFICCEKCKKEYSLILFRWKDKEPAHIYLCVMCSKLWDENKKEIERMKELEVKRKEKYRIWYEENKIELNKRSKKWHLEHLEEARESVRIYYARRKQSRINK